MSKDPSALDFLHQPAQPVQAQETTAAQAADLLPQPVADRLMALPGVQGVWIERQADGLRLVVLHVDGPGVPAGLPSQVHGLPVRVQGHAPINAQAR